MRRSVVINWEVSSFFGWGIYGLNLALHWANDPDIEPLCSYPVRKASLAVDALTQHALGAFLARSEGFVGWLGTFAGKTVEMDTPLLAGLGEDFRIAPGAGGVSLRGKPCIGVTFFETPQLGADAVARARDLEVIVTGSTWNARILREHGIDRVETVLQGVDPALFHPGPRRGLLGDRFLVFSGGKLERRKGQDIVLAAWRVFATRHPEALLVTAWHSPWPALARSVDASGLCAPVIFGADGKPDIGAWAAASDVPAGRILDLGAVPNALMPAVLREMDAAVFPNRGEGGTNLVAMECMACAVPTILSANTGHLDLIEPDVAYALGEQRTIAGPYAGIGTTPGWGESSIEEIVAALEQIHADRAEARRRAVRGARLMATLPWSRTAAEMKRIVLAKVRT